MNEARRGIMKFLFFSQIFGSPDAEGAYHPTMPSHPPASRPMLVRPKIGGILEAWVKEKEFRSAHVAINWEEGVLEVTLDEKVSDEVPLPFSNIYSWASVRLKVDESYQGSFTVPDKDAKKLIDLIADEVKETLIRNAKRKAERAERKRSLEKGIVSVNEVRVAVLPGLLP